MSNARECPNCGEVALITVNVYLDTRLGRVVKWTEWECQNCYRYQQFAEKCDLIELENQAWWWQQDQDEEYEYTGTE